MKQISHNIIAIPLLVTGYIQMASLHLGVMDMCDAANGELYCLDQSLVEPEVNRETISTNQHTKMQYS